MARKVRLASVTLRSVWQPTDASSLSSVSDQGISDAYYCTECTRLEKDRDGCPKIVNLGASRTDLFYERKCVAAIGHVLLDLIVLTRAWPSVSSPTTFSPSSESLGASTALFFPFHALELTRILIPLSFKKG